MSIRIVVLGGGSEQCSPTNREPWRLCLRGNLCRHGTQRTARFLALASLSAPRQPPVCALPLPDHTRNSGANSCCIFVKEEESFPRTCAVPSDLELRVSSSDKQSRCCCSEEICGPTQMRFSISVNPVVHCSPLRQPASGVQ